MNSLSLATILTVIGLSAMPAFASENGDMIFGRSPAIVEASLRERGVMTAGLEEWGTVIRAFVTDGNGGTTMQLFDPDTLEPVAPRG